MTTTNPLQILTKQGEELLARLAAEEKELVIDKFIFADVPDRGEFPSREEAIPHEYIVHEEPIGEKGRLTENSVIYTATLASDVGPFYFNWSGLYCSEHNVLVTIHYPKRTPKTQDQPGIAGNTLVRSQVLQYTGVAEITNITVDASTWQYNSNDRLKKMDADVAQALIDQNGKDWFIGGGFQVLPKTDTSVAITPGAGYVSGNRVSLGFERIISVPAKPAYIYLDAKREGTPTGEQITTFNFVVSAEEKDDYIDTSTGKPIPHFVCKIAQVLEDGSVSDLRPEGRGLHSSQFRSIQSLIDAAPEGGVVTISGKHFETEILVDKDITISFDGPEFVGQGYGKDIFIFRRGPKLTGKYRSKNHRLLFRVASCQSGDDFILDVAGSESLDCYGVIGGRPVMPINAGKLYLNGFTWKSIELAVNLYEFIFEHINYEGLIGEDMSLKPLEERNDVGVSLFNKYYCGGVYINSQGGNTGASLGRCSAKDINYVSLDPFTNEAIPDVDVEVHFFCVLCDGSATMANHVVSNLKSDKYSDNEGLLLRADRSIVESCIAVDAGGNEGTIYTKGATFSKISDSMIAFTNLANNNSDNRGAIVTSPYIEGYNNTFIGCGRGYSVRGEWAEFKSNHYISCISPVYLALQQDARMLLQQGETYDRCKTTATLNSEFKLKKYRIVNPTIELGSNDTIGSWSENNVETYELSGGSVKGHDAFERDTLLTLGASQSKRMTIKGLEMDNLKGLEGTTVSLFRATSNLKTLVVKDNVADSVNEFLRVRDRTIQNLIVKDNEVFDISGAFINRFDTVVTGKDIVVNNVGDDL
ncbi:phage tail protein [Vibrio navarrensis]|uniref:phage tail-collar fiber domain-containing protein n=1 Tax=Vibrio navarrensis TaxID=29495 RepID=UPI001558A59B|nr:phage tail protein [Vibrio navarrensis]